MKGWLAVFLMIVTALAYPIVVHSQANSEANELFGDEDEIGVIVVLKDDYGALQKYGISDYSGKDDLKMRKMMVNEQQESVFKELKLKKKGNGVSAQAADDYDFDLTNTYSTVNGFAGKLKKSSYEKLKSNTRVLIIEKSLPFKVVLDKSKEQVNASNTWRLIYNSLNITGRGESVCIIDSGVDYTHTALGGCTSESFIAGTCPKVIAGNNYCPTDDCNSQNSTPLDNNGHGTHVAGIVASTDNTFRGIAPDATIIAIKSLDSNGTGTTANIVAGIDWCINNASRYNISVISMSLGTTTLFSSHCDSASTFFTNAVATAIKNNISVIAATGNDGNISEIALPACITNVTSVGSVGDADTIPSYSNRNNITDLLAPGGGATSGNGITSTVPNGNCELCDSSGFKELSGTSMATPHVAAAFALLRQYFRLAENKAVMPNETQRYLNDTGKQITDSGSGLAFSRINIYAALLSLDTSPPALSFVNPTPANSTKTSSNNIFVNLSSGEVLLTAILDFNGTNETMQGSGLNWFKNKTVPSNQNATYTYKVWGNDSAGNMGISEFRIFISNNTPPSIFSFAPLEINFSLAEENSNFTFNITVQDSENDAMSITWYKNSTIAAVNSNFTFVNNFSAAGFYNITVDIFDGNFTTTMYWNLTVNNTSIPVNITSFFPAQLSLEIAEPNNQTFNISYIDRDGDSVTVVWLQNGTNTSSDLNFTFIGNSTASGFYNITVLVSDSSVTASQSWNLTVYNPAPSINSVNITNTDFLNRTNGTLQAFFSFTDSDGDLIISNETLWYINKTLVSNYSNKTSIDPINTTRLENWTFSARVFDGSNWSNFANSSAITILNSKPSINITALSISILETQLANISLNASDLDNDALAFASNKSDFSASGNYLLWFTDLTSSGNYRVNITVNDSMDIDSVIVNVTVIDARDLDNDGNPDFNDTDDDNDGILDENDFLSGNLSSINTTIAINITINGTSNLSKLFNGTFAITITNGSDAFIEFNFTFNSSNVLDFGNLTINRTTNGSSAVSIRGNLNLFSTKTIFLEKINATAKAACIKDADAGFDTISSTCDSANETLLACDNTTSGQYTCFDTGTRYKITGLSHSAVKEQCRDNDGDGFGVGCAAGSDGCDTDSSTSGSCPSGGGGSSGGGSSGGGGGGSGGGGGGGGLFFVCNMDWRCDEWTACANGVQARQCSFVRVPQHAQDTECPSLSNAPESSRKCEAPKQAELAAETCDDGIKNQNEDDVDCGGVCNPCLQENNLITSSAAKKEEGNELTGFSVKNIVGRGSNIALAALSLIIVSYIGIRLYRRKQQ